jgi:anaerobic selenocysteine-containing dehydrogenase
VRVGRSAEEGIKDRAVGLPARLHQHLRAGGRAALADPDRPGARLDAQRLHRRGDLREGRALRRAHPPSRPADEAVAPGRAEGLAQFAEISWADALDIVAEQFIAKARQHGSETIWPYYYAGTMGLVQRDGINRLRHAMKYSRWFSTICVTSADTGWIAGVGMKRGVDVREIDEHSDLVVIWGGNPVNTQVNVMAHAIKAKKRGARLVVVDPYRTGTAEQADVHLAVRPGTDGALAVGMMHVLFKEGYADWDYLRKYTDAPDELAAHVASRPPSGRRRSPACRSTRSSRSRGCTARPRRRSSAVTTVSAAAATALTTCTPSRACRR